MKRKSIPCLRQSKIICLPFDQNTYLDIVNDASKFRIQVDEFLNRFPELFPKRIVNGYQLKEIRFSQKLSMPIRRNRYGRTSYTIRLTEVMPYMTGLTDSVERVLTLEKILRTVSCVKALFWRF